MRSIFFAPLTVPRAVSLATCLALAAACTAQSSAPSEAIRWSPDSATVQLAAGPNYGRSAVHRFFWGKHYRQWWTTPVTAPVMRLATAVPGGLKPLQAGGSYQSRTLRLAAPDGRQYVLRSVDKDASRALPEGWKRQLFGGLMKDQTTVIQPYGAYTAASLADAAGVYHANPRLVYLANDPALGEFRKAYANDLYLLEERPDGDQRAAPTLGRSPRVVSTSRMLKEIHQRPSHRVDARNYLRARLLDVWLGDWSRREDQWRWASFPQPGGGTTYRPIPRDRDQAFFLFDDGVLTKAISLVMPRYQSFHARIKPRNVDPLTETARALDRTILGQLSAEDFQQVADSMQRRLTDAAITQALDAGPPETRARTQAYFGPLLRSRRAQLPAAARGYHQIIAREVWVAGTDQAERFVLSADGPDRVRVRLLARHASGPDSLVSEQSHARSKKNTINLYGLAGNDLFEIQGPLPAGFRFNVYSGAGQDEVQLTGAAVGGAAVTWHRAPNNTAPAPAGVHTVPDPDATKTQNAAAWLQRYRLDD